MTSTVNGKVTLQWEHTGLDSIARVHGGWIVKSLEDHWAINDQGNPICTGGYTPSMVFVPDPNHEWEMEDLIGIHK